MLRTTLAGACAKFCTAGVGAGDGTTAGVAVVPAGFETPPDATGATFAKLDTLGFVLAPAEGATAVPGAAGAVAAGANVEVDTGLLLNTRLVLVLGAGLGFADLATGVAGGKGVAVGIGVLLGATPVPDERDWGAVPVSLDAAERTTEVTPEIVRVTTDCTDFVSTARVVGFAGTSVLAVVTHPAAGFCSPLQLVKVVVDFTWQQPQSWDVAL